MLKAANLDSSHERLIKATITDLVYDDVRQKLIKVFAEESIEGDLKNSISSIKIKAEPSFYAKVIKMITNKRHQMKKGYIIRSSYRTVPSTMKDLFFEFFYFYSLFSRAFRRVKITVK